MMDLVLFVNNAIIPVQNVVVHPSTNAALVIRL